MQKPALMAGIVVAAALLAGCTAQKSNVTPSPVPAENMMLEGDDMMVNPSSMEGAGQPGTEVMATQDSETRVELEAKNFTFGTSKITVKKGAKLVVAVKNAEGFHDFVIDELEVNSGPIDEGTVWEYTIPTDKAGSFEYYCSVGKHREMGMKGTLVIEE